MGLFNREPDPPAHRPIRPLGDRAVNYIGEAPTISVPDADADPDTRPTVTYVTPDGAQRDLSNTVTLLPAVPDGPKGGGAPLRWQFKVPEFATPGVHVVTVNQGDIGERFEIECRAESPKAQAERERRRAARREAKAAR